MGAASTLDEKAAAPKAKARVTEKSFAVFDKNTPCELLFNCSSLVNELPVTNRARIAFLRAKSNYETQIRIKLVVANDGV